MTTMGSIGRGMICSLICLLLFASIADCLRGVPGRDFPIHNSATDTDFSCKGRVPGAYYADPSLDCQAYHICTTRRRGLGRSSFLCPNGTIFNQQRLICDWWFSASCSPGEDQYSGSEGVARGKKRSNKVATPREKPRSRKLSTSKELPRSSGTSKKADLIGSKKTADKKRPQVTKESARSKGGLGSPSRSSGRRRGVGKAEGQIQNSVGGKKRRKGGSKASGSRSRKNGRPKLKPTARPSQISQRVGGGFAPTPTPAPPLPITGRKEKDEQVVEYDVLLPELADYDLVEYSVELGAPSLGPRPQPSPALLSALDP